MEPERASEVEMGRLFSISPAQKGGWRIVWNSFDGQHLDPFARVIGVATSPPAVRSLVERSEVRQTLLSQSPFLELEVRSPGSRFGISVSTFKLSVDVGPVESKSIRMGNGMKIKAAV